MEYDLWAQPVTLTGQLVSLEPLQLDHLPGLIEAGRHPGLWEYMMYGDLSVPESMKKWVEKMLSLRENGTDLPFAVIHRPDGRVAGATRYMEMRPEHRALEIGGTWYGIEFQGTRVNMESKYLLLKYAFETLGCIRVQLKVDALNNRSIRAIEKLGAVKEGVLRRQFMLPGGRVRDSIYFSILDNEWNPVKGRLEAGLGGREETNHR